MAMKKNVGTDSCSHFCIWRGRGKKKPFKSMEKTIGERKVVPFEPFLFFFCVTENLLVYIYININVTK